MCSRTLVTAVSCFVLGVIAIPQRALAQTTYRVYDTFTDSYDPHNLQNHPPDIRPQATWWRWLNGEGNTLVTGGVVRNYWGTTREAWKIYSELRDAKVAVDFTSGSSSPHGGLLFRHIGPNAYFMLEANGPTLYRNDYGYLTYLGSGGKSVGAGERHRLGVRLEGSTIDVYFDEAFQFRVSDWTYDEGTDHGFYFDAPNDPTAVFDNFEISYLVPIPPCTFTVSPLGKNISADAFSGTVSVTAPADCGWSAWSETDFITLSDYGSAGPGTVRFKVENNTSSESRTGTFTVADSTITINQAARSSTTTQALSSTTTQTFDTAGGAAAPALPPPGNGIVWSANVPSGSPVNQCWGNCGAGCSNKPNPCGGPSYWSNEWLSVPQYVDDDYPISYCLGAAVITDVHRRYMVTGRWTYHGRSSDGCRLHDNICRTLGNNLVGFIGCVLAAVLPGSSYCVGARDENWSYTYVLYGHSSDPIATYVSPQPCSGEL